jgi:hypothetical protein
MLEYHSVRGTKSDYQRGCRGCWNSIRYVAESLTIREVAEDAGMSFGTWQKIQTEELQMRRVSAKFVPRPPDGGIGRSRVNLH